MDFYSLRKKLIEKEFSRMNDMQKSAVFNVNGAVLILAGAGSGKTTVLVNRIAYLIKYGNAYNSDFSYRVPTEEDTAALESYIENGGILPDRVQALLSVDAPQPWQILAITFTNKAANELKSRLEAMLGEKGNDVWASTFHSCCVRILRRDSERIGFSKHFTIYDTDDSKRVMKEVLRVLDIDEKRLPVKYVLNEIGRAKDSLMTPADYTASAGYDTNKKLIGQAFEKYEEMLKKADAMDFDDIIVNTVKLLKENPDVLEYYQRRFRYVMVDEYQDTNHAQYILTSLLANGYRNICVVGDDDQSIYKFRGATIENILSFENQYDETAVIRLEQNYRSTSVILDAANAVIKNNKGRKGKTLWTEKEGGDKIKVKILTDERDEGRFVADEILNAVALGRKFSDFAILYRTNAQSSSIERALVYNAVPYKVIGGHRFYDRKEVKDILAYLSVIANPSDTVRLRRIINEPKRGIGDTTINNAASIADGLGTTFYNVIQNANDYPMLSRAASKLIDFTNLLNSLALSLEEKSIQDFFDDVITKTGYYASLDLDKETAEERKANVMEVLANLIRYMEDNEGGTLTGFLEEVALMTDLDNYNTEAESTVMMTLHSAKGLEFPVVFIVGMEEGLFPGNQVMYDPTELEEERRLCYVGITRAKEKLYITNARSRMLFGNTSFTRPSRFLSEIPEELTDFERNAPQQTFYGGYSGVSYGGSSYSGGTKMFSQEKSYSKPSSAPKNKASGFANGGFSSAPKKTSTDNVTLDFKVGDTVEHKTFGKGMIVSAKAMGGDMLLEIAFDTCGTKKVMAKMAKLTKC
ncbi:MAG: UvrD-helicase domain-containing protein [Acutalibacteraceae bacterium]|nr:UvrD-helicase domain-containing protein [Acutalibacteraceae bacterium]